MVELKTITHENLEDVLKLSVMKEQKSFVSSTAHSLAQAYVYRETAFPFAIYADNTIVGFIMLGYYQTRDQYTLWKLLIDKNHQNKGYGKEALLKGLMYLKANFEVREIFTGVALGNEKAKHLYRSIGFIETGIIEDNMEEMKFTW